MNIKHKVTKRKDWLLPIIIIAIFSAILLAFELFADFIFPPPFCSVYARFVAIFIMIWIVTKDCNREMFQPTEFETLEHEVLK